MGTLSFIFSMREFLHGSVMKFGEDILNIFFVKSLLYSIKT